MSTRPKRSLPLAAPGSAPSIDAARRKLGGRVSSCAGIGRLLVLDGGVGVVLFATETDYDVWMEAGLVRRTKIASASAFDGEPPPSLLRAAEDARVFASLSEGQPVQFEMRGETSAGVLVEKCRFGALVVTASGVVHALGFRRLARAPLSPSS